MTKEVKKPISRSTYLTALALFTVAQKHYTKCRELELELFDLLGYQEEIYAGHISDHIYSEEGSFETAMKHENFTVTAPAKKPRKK